MNGIGRSNNLAARMGRWSARHRKIAIFGWLAFVAVAFVLGGLVGTKKLTDADTQAGESGRAARILRKAGSTGATRSVLVQSATHTKDGHSALVQASAGAPPRSRGSSRPCRPLPEVTPASTWASSATPVRPRRSTTPRGTTPGGPSTSRSR